jgi:CRISPR-associated protein Cas2
MSEYKAVWLFTMFDLPVDTKPARKHYAQFRADLRKQGFMMIQFSVYARYFATEESSEPCRKHVQAHLPPDGHVRLMTVTDKQFAKMQVFFGRKRANVEAAPRQLALF